MNQRGGLTPPSSGPSGHLPPGGRSGASRRPRPAWSPPSVGADVLIGPMARPGGHAPQMRIFVGAHIVRPLAAEGRPYNVSGPLLHRRGRRPRRPLQVIAGAGRAHT